MRPQQLLFLCALALVLWGLWSLARPAANAGDISAVPAGMLLRDRRRERLRGSHSQRSAGDTEWRLPSGPTAAPAKGVSAELIVSARRGGGPNVLANAHGCVTLLRDVAFVDGDVQTFGYRGPRATAQLCTIDSSGPVSVKLTKAIPSRVPRGCSAFAAVGLLQRPQHAMHFLWSVTGLFAMMHELGLTRIGQPTHAVPARVAVMGYGAVTSWADAQDAVRHPHIGLVSLVLGTDARVVVFDDWKSSLLRASPDALAPHECFSAVALGSFPQRVPGPGGVGLPPTALNVSHFTAMRAHVARRLGVEPAVAIPPPKAPAAGIVLLVRRQTIGRRILNDAAVIDAVLAASKGALRVVPVSWEGQPLPAQLTAALGAVGMIGAHGNGFAWQCMLPPGGFIVELTSRLKERNEVRPGREKPNAGNIGRECGLRTLSLECPFEETLLSTDAKMVPPHRRWKAVDLVASADELSAIRGFIAEWLASSGV